MACCPASPDEVFTVSQQQQLPTGLMPPVASPAALQPNSESTLSWWIKLPIDPLVDNAP